MLHKVDMVNETARKKSCIIWMQSGHAWRETEGFDTLATGNLIPALQEHCEWASSTEVYLRISKTSKISETR